MLFHIFQTYNKNIFLSVFKRKKWEENINVIDNKDLEKIINEKNFIKKIITFDEDAQNLTFVSAESFIQPSMAQVLTFTIESGKEATTTKTGFMGAGVLGLIGILMLGGFIADHVRKRK